MAFVVSASTNVFGTGATGATGGGAGGGGVGVVETLTSPTGLVIGYNVAPFATGASNIFVGSEAAYNIRGGNLNIGVGFKVGTNMGGDANVYVGGLVAQGASAASCNVAVGTLAGAALTTGSRNTLVGSAADVFPGASTRCVAVGVGAVSGSLDSVAVGASARASGRGAVSLGASASAMADGAFDIAGRIRGGWANVASPVSSYVVQVEADALLMTGGRVVALSDGAAARWSIGCSAPDGDLLFQSRDGAAVRMVNSFAPGVLNFTGQHRCVLEEGEDASALEPGLLVSFTGEFAPGGLGLRRGVDEDEATPIVRVTAESGDACVLGVLRRVVSGPAAAAAAEWALGNLRFSVPRSDEFSFRGDHPPRVELEVDAKGDSTVWVSDENGPVRRGDLLMSARKRAGHAAKQHGAYVTAGTVGKAMQAAAYDADGRASVRVSLL
jgi:hypothetical protein